MPWRPLLEGARAARAREAIRRLTEAARRRRRPARPGLALGEAGVALMHAYQARAYGDPAGQTHAHRSLRRVLLALERDALSGSFSTGLPGIAWTLAHLSREGLVEVDEALLAKLDQVLLGALEGDPWTGDYELHQGVVGLGTYALERLPRPAATRMLRRVIHHLGAGAERAGAGLAWPSVDERGRKQYLLGLSHGSAGMIAFLARMCELGVARARARRLLDDAMDLLLDQQLPPESTSRFPAALIPGEEGVACRSAWCHGDVGIAAALLLAARAAAEPRWERFALELARDVARRSEAESGIVDPTVCHGALGTAHLLNRMAQATGDTTLRTGARRFLGHGLRRWRAAVAGRAPYRELGQPGLVIGDAGLALALIAATTDLEPAWDRALSVAIAPR